MPNVIRHIITYLPACVANRAVLGTVFGAATGAAGAAGAAAISTTPSASIGAWAIIGAVAGAVAGYVGGTACTSNAADNTLAYFDRDLGNRPAANIGRATAWIQIVAYTPSQPSSSSSMSVIS